MNKKRSFITVLIITLAFVLFASWYNNYTNQAAVSTMSRRNRDLKIYLITINKTDLYWDYINQGASDMARLLGVTYQWVAPEVTSTQEQINLINQAVEDGANLIMLAANDPVAISDTIENAKANGVKFIYVDSPANEEAITTLATNNYSAGQTAAETMIAELEEEGFTDGPIGIIGVNTVISTTLNRERGFREVISADGRFTLLDTVYANGDPIASQEAAAGFISNNADLVGIFATNEGATIGTGNAIKESGKNIVGIGFDRSDEIYRFVNEGFLDAVIVQNPYTMGYLGMAQAYAALRGADTGPPYLNTGVAVLRRR